ncbi:MAG: GNAT family N-acetyltransferase [Lachnospiraceae bacterium]|nr:GNAT family N-acetyltransferase [Lachnospiraceae bacterium]
MEKGEFFTLKSIIFDMDTEMKLAKHSFLPKKRYHPLPGLSQILQALAQEGICLTMISLLSRQEINQAEKNMKIQNYFQHLISADGLNHTESTSELPVSDDETKRARLTSELLALALQKTGVTPAEVLLVTDSPSGVNTAKAAILPCIAFLHPLSEKTDLGHADILLEGFDGLNPSFFFHVYQRFHGKPITIASTKRLWLRELTAEDIPALCTIYQEPDIQRFITDIDDSPEKEIAKQTAYISTVYRFYGYGLWGIFQNDSDTLIGRCGIENHKIAGKEEIMLSYLLDRKYWGHGYALEACKAVLHYAQEELDMQRIVAIIDHENKRSLRTAASLKMKPEQELIYKGRHCTLFVLE